VDEPGQTEAHGALEHATSRLRGILKHDSAFWRRFMVAGVSHGPEALLRYSPPMLGWAFSAALPHQRRAVRKSLRMVHGPRPAWVELRDVAAVFANFASSMTDAMIIGTDRGYSATCRPVNEPLMTSLIASDKGLIVATAQTAGWDVAGGLLYADSDREVLVVMQGEPDEAARRMHDSTRNRRGVRVVHVGSDPLASLPLLKHLQRRGVVALKIDRVQAGMRTIDATFFGKPFKVPAGPLHLASLTGAAIVPSFTRRLGFLDYEPTNYPPVTIPRRASDADFARAAQQLVSSLESFVRAHPTQWIRFHED
jgi:KDO2-lipid IV(A) lauroyltransferase